MKQVYRGHEIEAKREKCLAGYPLLYYSVFRVSDGLECLSGYTTGSDKVEDFVGYLKARVDNELEFDQPWSGEFDAFGT